MVQVRFLLISRFAGWIPIQRTCRSRMAVVVLCSAFFWIVYNAFTCGPCNSLRRWRWMHMPWVQTEFQVSTSSTTVPMQIHHAHTSKMHRFASHYTTLWRIWWTRRGWVRSRSSISGTVIMSMAARAGTIPFPRGVCQLRQPLVLRCACRCCGCVPVCAKRERLRDMHWYMGEGLWLRYT